jgi:hypothetical protein
MRIDTDVGLRHARYVLMVGRRLIVLSLMLTLSSAQSVLCAGWSATPDDRMACCSDGGGCRKHDADAHGTPSDHARSSQSDADTCCAAAERDGSAQSPVVLALLLEPVAGSITAAAPATALTAAERHALHPVAISPVPRYLLLSVLLV